MADSGLRKAVDRLLKAQRINPKNLIATINGDMLVPHGGTVWLGSLVKMSQPFGIAEYLSRTTALRLVNDGWLHTTRVGKLSFYSLTEEHVRVIKDYYPRVYGPPALDDSGQWRLLLTGSAGLDAKAYTALRREFLWSGAGQLAPHVFISAASSLPSVEALLKEHGLSDRVQVLEAKATAPATPELMRAIVGEAWDIAAIEASYETFLARFRPIWSQIEREPGIDPELAFMIRVLLIMDYRRIALRDPRLPRDFLPALWAGEMAFALCRNIYQAVLEASEAYLASVVRTADGPLPEAAVDLYARFGGLERHAAPKRAAKA